MENLVVHYRVSSTKQGKSGLGMDVQSNAVTEHAESINAKIIDQYSEIESGGKCDRVQLQRALD